MRSLLTVSLIALGLWGCGSADDGADVAGPSPDGEWVAVSGVSDGSDVEFVEGYAVTIGVDDDRVVGTAACNRYSGTVAIGDDGSFEAGDLSWTEIGCDPEVHRVEQAYLTSLGNFTGYSVVDDVLTLRGASDEWVFERSSGG